VLGEREADWGGEQRSQCHGRCAVRVLVCYALSSPSTNLPRVFFLFLGAMQGREGVQNKKPSQAATTTTNTTTTTTTAAPKKANCTTTNHHQHQKIKQGQGS